MNQRLLIIILVINAVLLLLLGNRGPLSSRETIGLYAMANIAENKQVALPSSFERYPEAIKTANGKCLAPQPLWYQLGGSISYKISKVFFGVGMSWDGMKRYYRVASYLGNLIASTILILVFSQAIFVKGIKGREYLLLILPLVFFSLAFTYGMVLNEHLFVAAVTMWGLNFINGGVYCINRDLPYTKSFMLAGMLFGLAGGLSLLVIGFAIGFLIMFVTQKERKFQKAAVDMLKGSLVPVVLTIIFVVIYSHQCGAYVPPWPEIARMEGVQPGEALRYLFHSTFGLNGFFIYAPLSLIGIASLVKRLNHFQRLTERRKKLDYYARGQALFAWSVYWGGFIALAIFWITAVINGIPDKFNPSHLQMVEFTMGSDKTYLPSNLRQFGTPSLLFFLPVLHYFNLHIFREKPFKGFAVYYHEVVRIGALIAWVGLASPEGGYLVPFIWALNKIAVFMTDLFPQGTLFW